MGEGRYIDQAGFVTTSSSSSCCVPTKLDTQAGEALLNCAAATAL
jgi:hypothetical protein